MEHGALRRLAIKRGYVCPSCIARQHTIYRSPRRSFHASPWRKQGVLEVLEERGLLNQIAGNREQLANILATRKVSIYAGIDPTAPSLHLGHLLPLMVLFWLRHHGHNVISLVGGATSRVGDPSGRLTSRASIEAKEQGSNLRRMWLQMERLWERADAYGVRHGYTQTGGMQMLDNGSWLGRLTVISFLKILGSGMRIGTMLGRDTVRNKMEKGDGMSLAEFTYPLLQGWDWWHMYKMYGTLIQVGGADQYGNIIAGMDAVRYIAQNETPDALEGVAESKDLMGLTVPLLTTSSGEKFGKSAGNAVWLNATMTSAFDLYGFLLKTADADVERYLKLFTFIPLDTIREKMREHAQDPGARKAQHLLASELLELVHGPEEARSTREQHQNMRKPTVESVVQRKSRQPRKAHVEGNVGAVAAISSVAGGQMSEDGTIPMSAAAEAASSEPFDFEESHGPGEQHIILPESQVLNQSFPIIMLNARLASSLSEAKRMISAGGVYVARRSEEDGRQELDFVPVKSLSDDAKVGDLLIEGTLVLRLGKWKVRVVEVFGDEVFDIDMLRV